jgi:ppGpp synthetase/RelA/SpoT-type nucleotidyltranferase
MTLRHKLQFSRTKVDLAGKTLIRCKDAETLPELSLAALNDWRNFHTFPLNSITVVLKGKARKIQSDALIVERLKRSRSVLSKLEREPSMRLTQMQDIGGCRAVMKSVDDVYKLKESYFDGNGKYEIVHIDDYIRSPKDSGYRSIHLILRYNSKKYPEYNKLLLEIQMRTNVQHAWATAVETVGAVIGQALKSSEGEERWLKYFQNASLALEYIERPLFTTIIPKSLGEIARQLALLDKELKISEKLNSYREALKATETKILPAQRELKITFFTKKKSEEAYRAYEEAERMLPRQSGLSQPSLFPELDNYDGAQAVLVGAESFNSLRQCYPNYYLDTDFFLKTIDRFIKSYKRQR